MNDIINQKLSEYSEKISTENDAHIKLSDLYDAALKVAQTTISAANTTASVDDRISSLANGLQSILDLILEFRNGAKATKNELQAKIAVIKEIQAEVTDNAPTDVPEKKSSNQN